MDIESISISVKESCSEQFDNFTPTKDGGFCSSCQKEVIDFRKMSDAEIVEYFSKNKETVCGYFKKEQLKTYAVNSNELRNPQSGGFKYKGLVGLSLFSALSITTAKAQENPKDKAPNANLAQEQDKTSPPDDANNTSAKQTGEYYKGKVVDENKQPLPGVSIYVKGTNIGTISDFDGNYSIPKKNLKPGDILVINFIGYKTMEVELTQQIIQLETDTRQLETMDCLIVGTTAVKTTYVSKPTLWQRIQNWFR